MSSILGIPEFVYYNSKTRSSKLKDKGIEDPYVSKIGGYAIWHDKESAPSLSDLFCQFCGRNEKIILVCQIYAPIEDLHRSLYLFACNQRKCSSDSRGWIVIRNQKKIQERDIKILEEVSGSSSERLTLATTTSTAITNTIPPGTFNMPENIWNFDSLSSNPDKDNDDLLALLAQRDDSKIVRSTNQNSTQTKSTAKAKKGGNTEKKPKENKSIVQKKLVKCEEQVLFSHDSAALTISKLITVTVLPEILLVEVDDPYFEELDSSFSYQEEQDGEDDEEDGYEQFSAGVIDDEHVQRLLHAYLQDEDDPESIEALRNYSVNGESNLKTDGLEKEEFNEEDEKRYLTSITQTLQHQKKKKTAASEAPKKQNNSDKASDSDRDDEQEKSEVTLNEKIVRRKKAQIENNFRKRVLLEPNQVIRYAYGAEPVWISYPTPLDEINHEILPCPTCQSSRVYECQLMPALLSFISQPSLPADSSISNEGLILAESLKQDESISVMKERAMKEESALSATDRWEELSRKLGDSFDYGVVTIWSCPNSCSSSIPIALPKVTEIAVVQPSPDLI